jgi:hypothetical protein
VYFWDGHLHAGLCGCRSINFLELNVITSDFEDVPEESYQPGGFRYHIEHTSQKDEADTVYTIRPKEWLAMIRSKIGSLLSMESLKEPWGDILYEKTGTIRFTLDGEVQEEIILAKHLAHLEALMTAAG